MKLPKKIKMGLPKGSLNTPGRGNTYQLLKDAGYDIEGYEPGNESAKRLAITNDPEITPFLTRPQNSPVELDGGMLDIAIVGEDWIREWALLGIRKICDLEYGQTELVAAVSSDSPHTSLSELLEQTFLVYDLEQTYVDYGLITCFTEYINITKDWFMKNEIYKKIFGNVPPVVIARGLNNLHIKREKLPLIVIMHSEGLTEGFIKKGADIIVDNSQTGRTLEEYGLRKLEQKPIVVSSAGLYSNDFEPNLCGGRNGFEELLDWQKKKAEEIREQLMGAVEGKKYFDIKFDIPNDKLEGLISYLTEERLCSDEPTVSRGKNVSSVNILIPRGRFPSLISTLKQDYQARAVVRDEVKQYME